MQMSLINKDDDFLKQYQQELKQLKQQISKQQQYYDETFQEFDSENKNQKISENSQRIKTQPTKKQSSATFSKSIRNVQQQQIVPITNSKFNSNKQLLQQQQYENVFKQSEKILDNIEKVQKIRHTRYQQSHKSSSVKNRQYFKVQFPNKYTNTHLYKNYSLQKKMPLKLKLSTTKSNKFQVSENLGDYNSNQLLEMNKILESNIKKYGQKYNQMKKLKQYIKKNNLKRKVELNRYRIAELKQTIKNLVKSNVKNDITYQQNLINSIEVINQKIIKITKSIKNLKKKFLINQQLLVKVPIKQSYMRQIQQIKKLIIYTCREIEKNRILTEQQDEKIEKLKQKYEQSLQQFSIKLPFIKNKLQCHYIYLNDQKAQYIKENKARQLQICNKMIQLKFEIEFQRQSIENLDIKLRELELQNISCINFINQNQKPVRQNKQISRDYQKSRQIHKQQTSNFFITNIKQNFEKKDRVQKSMTQKKNQDAQNDINPQIIDKQQKKFKHQTQQYQSKPFSLEKIKNEKRILKQPTIDTHVVQNMFILPRIAGSPLNNNKYAQQKQYLLNNQNKKSNRTIKALQNSENNISSNYIPSNNGIKNQIKSNKINPKRKNIFLNKKRIENAQKKHILDLKLYDEIKMDQQIKQKLLFEEKQITIHELLNISKNHQQIELQDIIYKPKQNSVNKKKNQKFNQLQDLELFT